ncbi:TetR/AcrR family transcriptional regulator [Silicimonas algicola]|uniref:TetR family transcriptional regulator n=1 Tax=Silicimonas algicola TaxID=1826607 RepID=A0A316G626_9RHOB|nr:TetR/AcrR family transcriptional regulator [Silicimonas algicola]AZQ68823.1 TetR/AcrR family transcriptional regulator [Silicimonas algicola]PWK56093.1 TetR family transcriptional regulator [Silicimonas algicola]
MARDTTQRRAELRDRLIDIAEDEIRANGLASLRARALADKAGCAVGAIYNVFDDLTGLVLAVNGRTFGRMGAEVSDAVRQGPSDPVGTMVVMAKGYLRFALRNPRLWRALFDVQMTADSDVPRWYLEELQRLFALIAAPLRILHPETPADRIDLMTRALFSSVHGMVLLGTEHRISAVPEDRIDEMIEFLIPRVARP